jgi:uncharacterized RDD family membrane protein YckC
MSWHYHLNGSTVGPVQAEELQNLFRTRAISGETLVWSEGMADWVPYARSPLATGSAVAAAPFGAMQPCIECGRSFAQGDMIQYENAWVCAACKPTFFQRVREGVHLPGQMVYATFWHRVGASFLDGLAVGLASVILLIPVIIASVNSTFHPQPGDTPGHPQLSIGLQIYNMVISYGLPASYEIFLTGAYGATLGKMALRIKVVRADGSPINYGLSTGRYFAKILNCFTLYIGFLMPLWDEEKRALHDYICGTRVIMSDRS